MDMPLEDERSWRIAVRLELLAVTSRVPPLSLTAAGRAGLSETFQIEINNEGVLTCRLCDPRRLTA